MWCTWTVLACWSDSQVGVLRVWNVSRSTPLDSFKLKKTGFHALHVLNSPLAKKGKLSLKKKKKVLHTTWLVVSAWKANFPSSFFPQLRVLVLRAKVSTRVRPVRQCLRRRCLRTSPSLCLLARLFAASWMEASASTTWAPKSGTSSETWYSENTCAIRLSHPAEWTDRELKDVAELGLASLPCFPGSRWDHLWL